MAMTIKDMRDQVRSIIDIDSSDVSNDVLNRMLGQGFDYIVFSEKRWPFYEVATTFTTTSGTKDYSLGTVGASVSQGLREIMSLRTDDHILGYVGRDDADSEYPINAESSGTPWEWSYWNDTVNLILVHLLFTHVRLETLTRLVPPLVTLPYLTSLILSTRL